MRFRNSRLLPLAAIPVALAAGFALARLTDSPSSGARHADSAGSTEDEAVSVAHADGEDRTGKQTGAQAHADEGGHAEDRAGEREEGMVLLTQVQIEASGIDVVAVSRGGGGETRLSGRVEPSISARATVASVIAGRVERVMVAPGTRVRSGQALAVVVGGEAAAIHADAEVARADADAARQVFRRDRMLVAEGVVARQELETSRARSLAADALARAAAARASAAGQPDANGRVTIRSPQPGVVSAVQIAPGGVVIAGDLVATVLDPEQTELVFSAPPALAADIAPGDRIEVAGPAGHFAAVVVGTAADIHERGGMAVIRARVGSGALPPAGSPVSGIVVSSGHGEGLRVPADAVQTVAGRAMVFVATDEGFRATPVLTGRRAGDRIEVLDGLTGSERIAGRNAFLLKAQLGKGEAEHGH